MSDVFVSYKAEDRSRVEPLVDALEAEGLSVWWDARVSGGDAWREAISEQLDSAHCVIVVWSKRSTSPDGRFVRDEASRAQRRGTYLPVTIDKVVPPLGFGEVQALPLSGWKGDATDRRYRAISDCVHSILGRDRRLPGQSPPARSSKIDRRTALVAGGATLAAAAAGGWFLLRPSSASANTIAVLPFANLSGDPSQTYFSDGIAEELRNALAAIAGFEVVARTSSEMLRNADAKAAARKLNVAHVITGSVRRSPSVIRVSTQLIEGNNGVERWSQSFDRPFGDVLKIQSDIASNVARALSIQLAGHANLRDVLGGTTNPEAQDLVLQVSGDNGNDSSDAFLHRIALLDRAIQLDPNYAEAWARKGAQQSLWANAFSRNMAERNRVERDAMQSVNRAIAIAPQMSAGHATLGLILRNQLAMRRSFAELHRSVEIPGADPLAFLNYAMVLAAMRRQREAQSAIERGLALDPLNPNLKMGQSWILFLGRSFDAAIEAARATLAIAPENNRARGLLASSLVLLGRAADAQRELAKMPTEDYRRTVAEATLAARSGRKAEALEAIKRMERRYGDAVTYQKAQIYAQLGMVDEAIAQLEMAWTLRDSGLGGVQVDPYVDPLRNDPRLPRIVHRLFS